MFGKLFVTAAVILGAYLVIRARMRRNTESASPDVPCSPPILSAAALRNLAYGLLTLMLVGSALYLFLGWSSNQDLVRVQVINANTGAITDYQARRGDVEGRSFQTIDGRRVTLADVERMVLFEQGAVGF